MREVTVRYHTGFTIESNHGVETRTLTASNEEDTLDDLVQYVECEKLLYVYGDEDHTLVIPRDTLVDVEVRYVDETSPGREVDLLSEAWAVIANAGHSEGKPEAGWQNEHPEWQAAAARWREKWHATLGQDETHTNSQLAEHEPRMATTRDKIVVDGPLSISVNRALATGPLSRSPLVRARQLAERDAEPPPRFKDEN